MLTLKKAKRAESVRYRLKKNNKNSLRLSVYKSSQYLYLQIIDDNKGQTICSVSSLKKSDKGNGCNIKTAKELGSKIAEVAKSKNVESVYLDRGANIYHGIIKAIADEARAGGLRL